MIVCPPTKVLLEKNPLYVTRLEEERKAKHLSGDLYGFWVVEHIDYKNDDKNDIYPPTRRPAYECDERECCGAPGRCPRNNTPRRPCLPGNNAETGSNATATPVRSDRRRYRN